MNNVDLCTPMVLRLSSANIFCQSPFISTSDLNTAKTIHRKKNIEIQRPFKRHLPLWTTLYGPNWCLDLNWKYWFRAMKQSSASFLQRPDQLDERNHELQELRCSCYLLTWGFGIWPIWFVRICFLLGWLTVSKNDIHNNILLHVVSHRWGHLFSPAMHLFGFMKRQNKEIHRHPASV